MTGSYDARRAARLAAVQALYQMELTGIDAEEVAGEFIAHRFAPSPEARADRPEADVAPDAEFFAAIVKGVPPHQVEIDRSIAGCLAADWRLERVDSILRAILRAASFELIARPDVPARVVIDEYVEIAHAFFNADEPSFVNAALDKLAHRKRAAEFGETPPGDELAF
ncbi:MAG TPA: transcription antitermination factor NusB [Rhizomicrobium sp.]|jgi:N utilization substance protein B|nr:transcription antitermination factor NusB [Rhizomicrobium sp.]